MFTMNLYAIFIIICSLLARTQTQGLTEYAFWSMMMPEEHTSDTSSRDASWHRSFKEHDLAKLPKDAATTFVRNVTIPSSAIGADYIISGMIAGLSEHDVYILRRRATIVGDHWERFGGFVGGDYDRRTEGSIPVDCVIQYNVTSATVVSSYGSNVFYYPSFMTKDPGGNFWFADTAMQQVLQMNSGDTTPNQTIGTEFARGETHYRFCGPTAVAVTERHIYVADGLCNNRIVMYGRDLKYISEFGTSGDDYLNRELNIGGQSIFTLFQRDPNILPMEYLKTPVALAVDASTDRLFIAENGYNRVLIWKAGENDESRFGREIRSIHHKRMEKFAAIAFHPTNHKLFTLNAANTLAYLHRGFTFNTNDASFEGSWVQTEPSDPEDVRVFYHPLAMTVSDSGNKIYVVDIKNDKYVIYTFNHVTPNRSRRQIYDRFKTVKGDNSYISSNLDSMYSHTRSQNKGNLFHRLTSSKVYKYTHKNQNQSTSSLLQHILKSAGLPSQSHRLMNL